MIVMFLSAVWTLNLTAPIRCRASMGEQVKCNAKFIQILSDVETNSSKMAWGWVHCQQIVISRWTLPLKKITICSSVIWYVVSNPCGIIHTLILYMTILTWPEDSTSGFLLRACERNEISACHIIAYLYSVKDFHVKFLLGEAWHDLTG